MRQPCRVSHNTGESELMALPSMMSLPDSPLLKVLSEGQQGRSTRQPNVFLPVIFCSLGHCSKDVQSDTQEVKCISKYCETEISSH